jgi:hypothetical protein
MTGVLSEAGTAYSSLSHVFTPGLLLESVLLIFFVFCVVCVFFCLVPMSLECPFVIAPSFIQVCIEGIATATTVCGEVVHHDWYFRMKSWQIVKR